MVERQDIQFISNGLTCRGWLYKPTRVQEEKTPCVVLAHGFCGVKELRLDAYAERFADAGYHALVFDYRHSVIVMVTKDATTPSCPTLKAANEAPRGELITYNLGHFDVYVQPDFERTISDQLNFLEKNIGNPAI